MHHRVKKQMDFKFSHCFYIKWSLFYIMSKYNQTFPGKSCLWKELSKSKRNYITWWRFPTGRGHRFLAKNMLFSEAFRDTTIKGWWKIAHIAILIDLDLIFLFRFEPNPHIENAQFVMTNSTLTMFLMSMMNNVTLLCVFMLRNPWDRDLGPIILV